MMQLEFIFSRKKPPIQNGREAKLSIPRVLGRLQRDEEMTQECRRLLAELLLDELASKTTVLWNRRMRTTAGRAFWPDARIEINPKLKEIAADEIRRTMLHELAHLVAYERSGRRRIDAHGAEWRQACGDLGIAGERATHSLPLRGRKMKRKWRYRCPVCGDEFDRVRRMRRHVGCYSCCLKHNGGYYHGDYRLKETRIG